MGAEAARTRILLTDAAEHVGLVYPDLKRTTDRRVTGHDIIMPRVGTRGTGHGGATIEQHKQQYRAYCSEPARTLFP